MEGIVGANHMVTLASFPVRGAVRAICFPRAVVGQMPPGGALVQLTVRGSGAAASSRQDEGSGGRAAEHQFRLGAPRPHECGVTYSRGLRRAGRSVWLRIWTGPSGPSAEVRREIDAIVESLRPERG